MVANRPLRSPPPLPQCIEVQVMSKAKSPSICDEWFPDLASAWAHGLFPLPHPR